MANMVKGRLSVIIPGRSENYFTPTVQSALDRATGDIEVVAVVDGNEGDPPLAEFDDPRVKIIRLEKSIGQRAGYNLGVRESSGEFVMKIDAHALMSHGYDEALKAHCPPKTLVLPEMRRLDVHKWNYKRGRTWFMYFGLDLYCHYWRDYEKRPDAKVEYPEVLTGQGSCWFTSREWNDYIGLLDEGVGSWGNVGIEISLRTWLCGGSQIVNKKAWQAHWFRKDEGGFPYPMSGRNVARAHNYTRSKYYYNDNAFENQERPFSFIIEKFAPVPGWEAYMTDHYAAPRVIVYYTDSQLDEVLARQVRKQIDRVRGPIPVVSVSQEPLGFGKNTVIPKHERGYENMYKDLLAGLKATPEGSIVYLCEHDVFYHPSHFAFLPPEDDHKHAFFNLNRVYYRLGLNNFLPARGKRALSQCVAYRDVLIRHCEERLAEWERTGKSIMRISYKNFKSERPNIDIRHGDNLTSEGDYKRAYYRGEATNTISNLPGWGSARHFQGKVGYKEPVDTEDTAAFLLRKYKKWMPQVSPIRVPRMKRHQLASLFRALGFKRGAEVGVRDGRFSEVFLKRLPDLELFCVDPWSAYYHFDQDYGDTNYKTAKRRFGPYGDRVTMIRKMGQEGARDIPDESLDFVYLDGDHRFDFVMEDLITWNRKLKPGGILCGHDYYRFRNSGVVPAVDVFTKQHGIDHWFITDEKEASFFWSKGEDNGLSK